MVTVIVATIDGINTNAYSRAARGAQVLANSALFRGSDP
jgi:hypothetical protein